MNFYAVTLLARRNSLSPEQVREANRVVGVVLNQIPTATDDQLLEALEGALRMGTL
jgi:hypothetical protein